MGSKLLARCIECVIHSDTQGEIELMERFQFVKGRKSPKDHIMLFNGVAVKFEDVAKMCLFFMKNEDNLYPPEKGFKGATLFKEYMYEVLETRQIPQDRKYEIKKNKLTKITEEGEIYE
jgi:hypothetical protein